MPVPSRPIPRAYLVLLTLLLVCVTTSAAFAWGILPHHPYLSPGHPCSCGSGGGEGDDGGDCGHPAYSVNPFTGDLIISDMPLYYQGAGSTIPFVMTYSAQSSVSSPFGTHWTHSYNMKFTLDLPNGALLTDGNARESYFYWDILLKIFSAQVSRNCRAHAITDGSGNVTGSYVESPIHPRPSLNPPQGQAPPSQRAYMEFDLGGKLVSMKDSNGLTWTLSYTGTQLNSVSDPKSRNTTFTYTSGKLTRVTNPGSQHADFTYDGQGRLSTATDAAGDTYTYGYNGTDTKITSITDPSGRQTQFTYTTFRNKPAVSSIAIVGASSSAVTYTYSPQTNGQLYVDVTQTKDAQSRVTRYIYENTDDAANGRYLGSLLVTVQDCGDTSHLNYTRAWIYNSNYTVAKYRDSYQTETGGKEHRHWYYYEDSANAFDLTKFIDGENADANPPTSTCPAYRFEYDTQRNLSKVTTPESREVDLAYVTGTHRLSSVTLKDKDINNNPVDRVTSFSYYGVGTGYLLQSITDARGNVTSLYYDSNWYLDYIDPPFGNNIDVTANSVGDITSVTDGNGNTTSYQYDGIHRLTSATFPNLGNGAKSVSLNWTCCGLDQVTDENGVVTKFEYDPYRKWLTKIHEDYTGLNYVTEYTYDEVGNVKTAKNARLKTTSYTYNNANQVTRVDYPDSTYETWTYRDDGRVLTHTDGRGRQTTFRYDADDRLSGPSGSGYVAINFPNNTDVNLTRDKDGLVTAFTDGSGTSSATYYPSGWLKTFTNAASKTVTYQYNGVGLLSRMTTPGSLNFDYTYNALNLPDTVVNPNSVTTSFSYDNGARLSRITRPGSYIDFTYNARDWITAVLNRTTGGSTLYDARYYYQDGSLWDNVGNPLKRVENFGGSDYTTTLRYDAIQRQTEETKRDSGGIVQYTLGYGYDAVGNRTSRAKDGTTVTYVFDDNNKLSSASGGGQSASFGYDNNGNMTSVSGTMFGSKSMIYDDVNALTSLTSSGVTDLYSYNVLGQRYRARLSGTYQRYVYNGDRLLEETDDSGNVLSRFTTTDPSYSSPLLHMWRSTSTSRFPLFDLTGSAREEVDASAAVTDTYTLDTFGRQIASTGTTTNPHRYDAAWGYLTDPSGFQQLGYRFYWPELGRFLQQDPAGNGVNWYVYARNNPLLYVDPLGLLARGGAGDWIDQNILGGATQHFGCVMGSYDAGHASIWDVIGAGAKWGAGVVITALTAEQAGADLVALAAAGPEAQAGTTVYRVFGRDFGESFGQEGADLMGHSWTPVNPADVARYRDAAGLFPQNQGRFVAEGVLNDATGIVVRPAAPGPGGVGGGLTEYLVPDPASQITVTGVYGVNPPL